MKQILKIMAVAFALFNTVNVSYGHNWNTICKSICQKQKEQLCKYEYSIADGYKKNRKQLAFYFKNVSHEGDTLYFLETFRWGHLVYVSTFWVKTDSYPRTSLISYTGRPINYISDNQVERLPYSLEMIDICNRWDSVSFKKMEYNNPESDHERSIILTRVILYKKRKYKIDCMRIIQTW